MVLMDATDTESGYVSNVNRVELLGKVAKTTTPLRPAGTIELDGERIDVVSQGSYIDRGKDVIIVKVEGSRIVVRETDEKGKMNNASNFGNWKYDYDRCHRVRRDPSFICIFYVSARDSLDFRDGRRSARQYLHAHRDETPSGYPKPGRKSIDQSA